MRFETHDADKRRSVRPIIAFYSIIGFWLFHILIVTARSAVLNFPAQAEMAQRRIVVTAVGIVLTWLLYLIIRMFDRKALWVRVAVAFLVAIPCAIALAFFNYYIFNVYDPINLFDETGIAVASESGIAIASEISLAMWKDVGELALSRYFFFAAWAALYLAISYAGEVRVAERRAAKYARAAQQAELRSLRYQVNPHFLFNTLNSLSSLVMKNSAAEAETMIMNLSTFYRTSLSGDPLEDVTLEEEVHLQRLYLDIEAVRFPERLRVKIDIPDNLLRACVPGLILQPLVENAIKYGVSRANRPVTITVAARSEYQKLILTVTDNGNVAPKESDGGSGIGLANVRDRLAARFEKDAKFEWLAPKNGGFIARITIPEVYHDR